MKDEAKMIIVQGKIQMKDGSNVEKYIKEWQKSKGHSDGTEVRLMTQEQYARTRDLELMVGIG